MNVDRLFEIATELNSTMIIKDLSSIKQRAESENVKIVLPLVGEFSAGKTTLINALTDNKQLETATKPTTATIYELHFGCDSCYAEVLNNDGSTTIIDDICKLKNDEVKDALVVNIYDTSKKIPSTTIVVDTPGLSSDDIRHRQALVDFMPHADGIILVVDINSQLTRSLTEFVKTMELTKRPIYLVLTKSDTKSQAEIEATRKYIKDNTELQIREIVCVSAYNGELEELYSLMEKIQKDKNSIIKQVDEQRLKLIVSRLLCEINDLQSAVSSDKELENSINNQEKELKKLNRNVDKLVSDTECEISELEIKAVRVFQNAVFNRLNTLVSGKSNNFDAEAVSVINNTSSVVFNDYKNSVKKLLNNKVSEKIGANETVSLNSINIEDYSISEVSYNLDLNSIGHKYDGMISTGLKIAAAATAVVAAGAIVSSAAAAGTASSVVNVTDMALDAADTVTDIQSIASNKKTVERIEAAVSVVGKTNDKLTQINEYDSNIGNQVGCQKGLVESMVGFAMDKAFGKPQRIRAINNYLDTILLPDFKNELSIISNKIISAIVASLKEEISETISSKTELLNQLKKQKALEVSEYKNRMSRLCEYKNELQIIK